MKETIPILYLGLCENPACESLFHYASAHAIIDTSELPVKCEKCGGRIRWETGMHRHDVESIKKKSGIDKVKVIAWSITILLILALTGAIVIPNVLVHREYTDEEMTVAVREMAGMSIAEILTQLNRDKDVAKMLGVSPYVIQRLRIRTTTATPALACSVRGIFCQYLLNKRSWLLTRMQIGVKRGASDLYYAFPDPLCEIE